MKSIALYYSMKCQKEEKPADMTKAAPAEKADKAGETANDEATDSAKKDDLRTELHVNIWKVEEGTYKLSPRFYFDFGRLFGN